MAQSIGDSLCMHPKGAERKNECSSLERGGRTNELEMFEAALLCILQEENPLPMPQNELRKEELSRRLRDSGDLHCSDPAVKGQTREGLDGEDLGLLSKLLNQVRLLKAKESQSDIPSGEVHCVDTADLQELERKVQNQQTRMERTQGQLLESVAEVASAAAEVAKAVAASASKNFETMESLRTTLNKSDTQHDSAKASYSSETSMEDCDAVVGASDLDDHTKKLVKVVEKQNKITHWILGFMVITTAIWRFKALSVVFGVQKTITNPFYAIVDLFSKGFTKEESSKAFQKARTALPSLLQGGLNETSKGLEQASSEDVKIGEGLTVSLDNILSIGKSSNNQSAGNSSSNKSDK